MIRIGTSGWNYRNWKETFYQGAPRRLWLTYLSERFPAVEVNATYYRSPKAETQEKWIESTADDFVFAAKGHRIVTHSKKLKDAKASVEQQRDTLKPLGPKLAVMLWQLPASFKCDIGRIKDFLDTLKVWPNVRHVMEFRDTSCFTDEMAATLDAAGVGNVISDAADWPMWEKVTGNLAYVRLHGHTRTYASGYSDRSLDEWADKVRGWAEEWADVFVFFDNDAEGHAPFDALKLMDKLGLADAAA